MRLLIRPMTILLECFTIPMGRMCPVAATCIALAIFPHKANSSIIREPVMLEAESIRWPLNQLATETYPFAHKIKDYSYLRAQWRRPGEHRACLAENHRSAGQKVKSTSTPNTQSPGPSSGRGCTRNMHEAPNINVFLPNP